VAAYRGIKIKYQYVLAVYLIYTAWQRHSKRAAQSRASRIKWRIKRLRSGCEEENKALNQPA